MSYYLVSVALISLALGIFFLSFESRRPQAREVVLVSVMCALAVASRVAFAGVPYVKPVMAVIMISGVAFGWRVGFLTGSMTALVSNFVFSQGPWTPWQMIAYGIAGLIVGVLADKGLIPRSKWNMKQKTGVSVAAGFMVVFVVGPILDTSSLFLMVSAITPKTALAVYAAGFPMNLTLGIATAVCLFVFANPLLEKLERVRVKYGLFEE